MYMDVFGQVLATDSNSSMSCFKDVSRILYPHYTCATDTQNICTVFEDIKDAVLAAYLDEFNLV